MVMVKPMIVNMMMRKIFFLNNNVNLVVIWMKLSLNSIIAYFYHYIFLLLRNVNLVVIWMTLLPISMIAYIFVFGCFIY